MFDLNECEISRRGKGAKGTVKAFTFGVPCEFEKGITKEWDYSKFAIGKVDPIELQIFLSQFGDTNIAMVMQIDNWLKSENSKNQAEANVLAAQILEEGLESTKDDALNTAKALLQTLRNLQNECGDEDTTIEFLLEKKRAKKAKEAKAAEMLPRLAKNGIVIPNSRPDSE